LMKPYWVWRDIVGFLMFVSHLVFSYNFYYLVHNRKLIESFEAPALESVNN